MGLAGISLARDRQAPVRFKTFLPLDPGVSAGSHHVGRRTEQGLLCLTISGPRGGPGSRAAVSCQHPAGVGGFRLAYGDLGPPTQVWPLLSFVPLSVHLHRSPLGSTLFRR